MATKTVKLQIRTSIGFDLLYPETTITAVSGLSSALSAKQDTLVSGTNIKTINNTSLLGSGNIVVSTSLASLTDATITNPAEGEGLFYDATAAKWVNRAQQQVVVSADQPAAGTQTANQIWFDL